MGPQRRDRRWQDAAPWAMLAFAVPAIIHAVAFCALNISPFGDRSKTMMVIDNFHQYSPFLSEYREIIRSGGSLLYSWNSGLGSNYWARFGYYLASPLNLFFALFPAESLPEFIVCLSILRTGLSGLFCWMFLRDRSMARGKVPGKAMASLGAMAPVGTMAPAGTMATSRAKATSGAMASAEEPSVAPTMDLGAVAFAAMYAISSFTLAYYWNIMWFDCIAVLPLIAMGLERLVRERKAALYCLSLGFAIYTNYYIALIICIFCALYFLAAHIAGYGARANGANGANGVNGGTVNGMPSGAAYGAIGAMANGMPGGATGAPVLSAGRRTKRTGRLAGFASSCALFAGASALAAGLAAVILLPAYSALSVSQSAGASFPRRLDLYYDAIEILSGHLANVQPSVMSGLPNVYCGVAVLVLVPLFLANRRIAAREKAALFGLALFLLAGFNVNYLNFIWHGLHFPNSLSYRFAFIYILLAVIMSHAAYTRLGGVGRGAPAKAAFAASSFALLLQKLLPERADAKSSYASVLFLAAYAGIFAASARRQGGSQKPAQGTPGIPDTIGNPSTTDTTDNLGNPGIPGTQGIPGIPGILGISGVPGTPSTPSTPNTPGTPSIAALALLAVTAIELAANAALGMGFAGAGQRGNYMEGLDSVKAAVAEVGSRSDGPGDFFRVEFLKDTVSNTPSLYGYKGVSYFSSTVSVDVTDLMGGLGMRPSSAWYVYKGNTPVVNALLSIRYLLSKEDTYANPLYPLVSKSDGIRAYENPYQLPLGFMADEAVLGWEPSYADASKVFQIQNDFLRLAAGSGTSAYANDGSDAYADANDSSDADVMELAALEEISVDNATVTKRANAGGGAYRFEITDASQPGYANYVAKNPDGRPLYLYVKSRQVDYVWFIKDGKSEGHSPRYYPYVIDTQYYGNAGLGSGAASGTGSGTGSGAGIGAGSGAAAAALGLGGAYSGDVELSLKFEEDKTGEYEIYGAYFNEGPFIEAFNVLASRPLAIERFSDTGLAGRVDAGGGGILMTTIPFDEGWRALVDGEAADTLAVGGGFLALRLGAGEHGVELSYAPPMFWAGLTISLASAALCCIIWALRRRVAIVAISNSCHLEQLPSQTAAIPNGCILQD